MNYVTLAKQTSSLLLSLALFLLLHSAISAPNPVVAGNARFTVITGGAFTVQVGDHPNTDWGSSLVDRPYSLSTDFLHGTADMAWPEDEK